MESTHNQPIRLFAPQDQTQTIPHFIRRFIRERNDPTFSKMLNETISCLLPSLFLSAL